MTRLGAIRNEWFAVASCADLRPGSWQPFNLLDDRFLLLCDLGGEVTVTRDTCPHRGAQLSLGSFDGERIASGYHGWEFDMTGRCIRQPAHPDRTPPAASGLELLNVSEAYGLWWVCIGEEPRNLPLFPAYEAGPGLSLTLDPAVLESSGPRIIENFLDVAHFPYVHANYLGQVPHTAISRYGVEVADGELRLSNVTVWQPKPGPLATRGGPVAYEYSVSHPYAATLTKVPSEHDGGEMGGFSILLIASPVNETECLVWRVVTVRDPEVDFAAQRDFNRTIFDQDIAIVESQMPKRLPIDPTSEAHQRADAGSLAYRKWLVRRGITYGTVGLETLKNGA